MPRPRHDTNANTARRRLEARQVRGWLLILVALTADPVRADDVFEVARVRSQSSDRTAAVDRGFGQAEPESGSGANVGFDFASSESPVDISNASEAPTVALSITLTAPGPGSIEADFSTYLAIGHTVTSSSYVICALRTDTSSPETVAGRLSGSRGFVHVPTGSASTTYYPHMDTMGVLTVDAATTVTIHAVCYRSTPTTSGTLAYRSLTATFQPDRF